MHNDWRLNWTESHVSRRWVSLVLWGIMLCLILWQGTVVSRSQKKLQAEREATQIEREFAQLIIITRPFPLIMCDPEHKITITNPAAEAMFGWSRKEMLGKPIEMLMPEAVQKVHEAAMDKAATKARQMPGDWSIRKDLKATGVHRDGTEIPIQLSVTTIKYKNNVRFIAGMRDMRPQNPPPSIEVKKLPAVDQQIKDAVRRTEKNLERPK